MCDQTLTIECLSFFFFQAEDGIRDVAVTGVQTCALPISDDRFFGENGAITLAGTTIHDWKKYGWLTFAEVLQNSSNVGSIKVGLALGRGRYHRYMKAFGFGTTTGGGLAGESRGRLRDPQRWWPPA